MAYERYIVAREIALEMLFQRYAEKAKIATVPYDNHDLIPLPQRSKSFFVCNRIDNICYPFACTILIFLIFYPEIHKMCI